VGQQQLELDPRELLPLFEGLPNVQPHIDPVA